MVIIPISLVGYLYPSWPEGYTKILSLYIVSIKSFPLMLQNTDAISLRADETDSADQPHSIN